SFALAAEVYQKWDPELAAKFGKKASEAWDFALSDPGVCQTACVVSPYFYEEENYVDDLELAAATLAETNASTALLKSAAKWGELEQVTPWMELHRARHYQYYPFVNLGHALLAQKEDTLTSGKFIRFMKQGLTALRKYAGNDPFQIGVPFIWCSNNLVVAAATQARLYRTISGDTQFAEMEASLTDWLFGCNPWGTSMICGLPANGDYPEDPHSAISDHLHQPTWGGLVDGPVYNSIYSSLLGITLRHKDSYADFQHGQAVYHDDSGDYSTNEPTMDGTASLSYLLSSLESQGTIDSRQVRESEGAIIRTHPEDKTISLLFSAHDRIEGGESILQTLRKYGIKASFFFTGDFLREQRNADFIRAVQKDGHYIGPHSDKHLLYADWKQRDALLVTREQFAADMQGNRAALLQAGISPIKANIFLPPYEWYNREVAGWCREMGLTLINFTPGTRTNADYLSPEQPGYRSSAQLMDDLLQFERKQPQGLNGSFLLIHPGTVPERKDKLYNHLDQIIRVLQKKGYRFERVDTALKGQTAPDGLSQTK
ncbi:MAG: glycoside hydrolase family 9 protein, partial [Marinilabiliales bacterium]|nr:glycoside hydrolase family 9 protein [Marinilabiliales bacterium]